MHHPSSSRPAATSSDRIADVPNPRPPESATTADDRIPRARSGISVTAAPAAPRTPRRGPGNDAHGLPSAATGRQSGRESAPPSVSPERSGSQEAASPGQTLSGSAVVDLAPLDPDALYAYHLNRVTRKFTMVISADNMALLARLLDDDHRN